MVRATMLVAGCLTVVMALTHTAHSGIIRDGPMTKLVRQLNSILESFKTKRGCSAYICGHSHMAQAASEAVLKRYMYKLLWNCARDERLCNINKRKRRDVSHEEQFESRSKETSGASFLHKLQTRSALSKTRPSLSNLLLKSHTPS